MSDLLYCHACETKAGCRSVGRCQLQRTPASERNAQMHPLEGYAAPQEKKASGEKYGALVGAIECPGVGEAPAVAAPSSNNDKGREAGEALFNALGQACVARILRADANCEPPSDVLLRLEAIILERDELRLARSAITAREVVCTKGEYAELANNSRRYEWLRDNMRRMPMGEAGARHFFDQPGTMSFQEAVDEARALADRGD